MTTNTYNVEDIFPNGLNLSRLVVEMNEVWPADLIGSTYSVRDSVRTENGFVMGVLEIETPRDLTDLEAVNAIDRFGDHLGGVVDVFGLRFAELPDPSKVVHRTFFVSDVSALNGVGMGTLVYSDGNAWKRVSNDRVLLVAG